MNNIHVNDIDPPINTENLIAELNKLTPSTQQRNTLVFRELYPTILELLGRKTSMKKILAVLAAAGMKLSMGGFRAQLKAEAERRENENDHVMCSQCGHELKSSIGNAGAEDAHA